MQENNVVVSSNEVLEIQNVENIKIEETKDISETETTEIKKELPKRSIELEDGTIISNLKITYRNLFDFQNSYDGSKDLLAALIKKQTFDQEVMIQLIYVGYLGTNPDPKMEYLDFIDAITFDYKRDMNLFNELVGLKAQKN